MSPLDSTSTIVPRQMDVYRCVDGAAHARTTPWECITSCPKVKWADRPSGSLRSHGSETLQMRSRCEAPESQERPMRDERLPRTRSSMRHWTRCTALRTSVDAANESSSLSSVSEARSSQRPRSRVEPQLDPDVSSGIPSPAGCERATQAGTPESRVRVIPDTQKWWRRARLIR